MDLRERTLRAGELVVFEGMDEGWSAEPDALGNGVFLVARAKETSSRLALGLGTLARLERFT
ncbi:MAG TPA: hypothetical protein VF103_10215, partial [Polyangiaceae bacterium]